MISDNYVTGDNVFLRELQNFFFMVLGMMSVTHYGAIGDGRTDNYAALQVAIDDANRRGLSYIYVPYGRYRFRGELINRDGITFIGNPRAKIFNDKTGEEIEVKQFGWAEGGTSLQVRDLTSDMILVDGEAPELEEGFYYTGAYNVYMNSATADNVLYGTTEIFYYHASDKTLVGAIRGATYDTTENVWLINEIIAITNEIVDDRNKIPTSKAVKDYVDSIIVPPGENYFMSSIAPTTWETQITVSTDYSSTNGYGTWEIYAGSASGADRPITLAFDDDLLLLPWRSDTVATGSSVTIGMNFPILIKPTELSIITGHSSDFGTAWTIEVQGQNTDDTWTTIWITEDNNSTTPQTHQMSGDSWFKGFRAIMSRPDAASNASAIVTDFRIAKGYWKEAD